MTDRFPKGSEPRVRLRIDTDVNYVGLLVEQGEIQSIVRWPNGNEDTVINDWIVRVEGPQVLKTQRIAASTPKPGKLIDAAAAGASMPATPAPAAPKKPRKEPDALALRVAEFDDAKLQKFAEANGCWQSKYLELPNNGLRRMNVLNRLRAKVKNDAKYKVVWP